MAELMQLLAGRAVGHVDLKETSCADVIVRQAVEALGPAGVIVTTGEDDGGGGAQAPVPGRRRWAHHRR